MTRNSLTAVLLGIWLGGSAMLFWVVGYNFAGIEASLAANEELADKAGFDPDDSDAKKTSVIWVYASELNRAFFHGFNRAQLIVGGATLLFALMVTRRKKVVPLVALALVIACVLAFYLGPEITELGRTLDFEPRTPPPEGMEKFDMLHTTYRTLEIIKVGLVLLAVPVVCWPVRNKRNKEA